jgi:hypothetical protein
MEEREIRKVALLDLTGAGAAGALDGVTRIVQVAAILVPESLLPRLSSIPMEKVAATIPIPDGHRVKVMTGQITMSGEALAAPPADGVGETLVITGQLVLTSPFTDAGREVIIVGQVVAPAGSEAGVGKAVRRMTGQVVYYPYTPGARVVLLPGGVMAGEALAHLGGQEGDVRLMLNSLVLTSKPPEEGYNLVVLGNVLVPRGGEAPLYGRVLPQNGQIIAYDAPPRLFSGNHRVGADFFEMLDEPITLVVDGNCIIEDDVTPELVRQKVRGFVLDGNMKAPRAARGAFQALALALDGNLSSNDSDE